MRPILILFVMGATGFGFILQKKDVVEPVVTKLKLSEPRHIGEHNWMKHSIDQGRVVAQNDSH